MRAMKNEYFLGGMVKGMADRVNKFKEDRPAAARALGGFSGMGMVNALRDRIQAKKEMENGGIMKYRAGGLVGGQHKLDKNKDGKISGADFKMMGQGGMIYAQDSDQVTEKEKRFVQSAYGSGEDRITAADIKSTPGLDPFREYIPGQGGMRAKKMSSPGYFLIPGYTDEQRQKDIEAGRKLRDDQTFVLEVMPDGSKRTVSLYDVMDEFTSGAEDEGLADVLEAMDIGITRTDSGFSLPSREEQIRTLMKRRANYGLGDVGLEGLQKQLGLNVPEMQEGEYRDALERALSQRAAGQVTQARGSR